MVVILNLANDLVHRLDLSHWVDIGSIHDMHQQVGIDDLLQSRTESLDELGRQMPDESDGVGEHHWPAVIELAAPGGWF